MDSTRLPGKVLADIDGKPALTRLLQRLQRAECVDDIILATTEKPVDDSLALWAQEQGVKYFRGEEDNVLARVVAAHQIMKTHTVVKICGDMPLLDPIVIDKAVQTFQQSEKIDVVTTTRRRFFPDGVDVEVFPFSLLTGIADAAVRQSDKEHVTSYFYRHSEDIKILDLLAPLEFFGPHIRLVLDYPEDLYLIRVIYRRLELLHGANFHTSDVIDLLKANPALLKINAQYLNHGS